jgi:TonB family protein
LSIEGSDRRPNSRKGNQIDRSTLFNSTVQNPSHMNIRIISSCLVAAALCASASAALQSPKPISQAAPAYALDLRQSDVEGEVVVSFTITASGDVINPSIVSSTDRDLNHCTLAAVRKWKFAPAMQDGVAVSVKALQPVAFKIPELHADASARLLVSTGSSAVLAKNPASTY